MKIKNKKTILAVLLSAFFLGVCASNTTIPDNPEERFKQALDKQNLIDEWKNSEPAITYIDDNSSLLVDEPMRIPNSIHNMPFNSSLSASGTMSDLAGILKPMGIFVAIPDEELRDKSLVLFDFDGKLGDF